MNPLAAFIDVRTCNTGGNGIEVKINLNLKINANSRLNRRGDDLSLGTRMSFRRKQVLKEVTSHQRAIPVTRTSIDVLHSDDTHLVCR